MTAEEKERRRREAFRAKGLDYDEYEAGLRRRKAETAARKQANIERSLYRPSHEDAVQFGCCYPDTDFAWGLAFS